MPLTSSQKKGAAVVGGLALALIAVGAANASDDVDDGGDDDGGDDNDDLIIVDPPVLCPPGQVLINGVCVVPPPAPNPINCNYLGCGAAFDGPQAALGNTAITVGIRLQQLGYPLNPAAGNFTLISAYAMSVVREFQRDYNAVRAGGGYDPISNNPKLDTDGLTGVRTIAAINRARQAVITLATSWKDIVGLA